VTEAKVYRKESGLLLTSARRRKAMSDSKPEMTNVTNELTPDELAEVFGGKAGQKQDEYYKVVLKEVFIAGV
jgi:hypothetical protein